MTCEETINGDKCQWYNVMFRRHLASPHVVGTMGRFARAQFPLERMHEKLHVVQTPTGQKYVYVNIKKIYIVQPVLLGENSHPPYFQSNQVHKSEYWSIPLWTQIKENTKAPRHWPLCCEFTEDRWIPRTNGQ